MIEKNEFPVVFVGAGLSKRFLNDFPDWTTLLEDFWKELGLSNFFGEFNKVRDSIGKENPHYSDKELNHYSNIRMGSILEENYNGAFNDGKVSIPNFSARDAYYSRISPFKKAISEKFKMYTFKNGVEEEYSSFQKMLLKAQIILSTNYDKFIEESYDNISEYQITKYIGQKGFFQDTLGYAELYKLHGCVDSPENIIITENDYENFEKNSVLISAKIISMMMNSSIIFVGYSLTDINVRKIIKEFTRSLTDHELSILEDKLVLVEWKENEQLFVEEVVNDQDLGCKLRVIKTDNFQKLFSTISTINQGVSPSEVRKYKHVIKELIIDRGKKGALHSVLLSPEDLDSLEQGLLTKNITVAIGDAKYIFQIPDLISYCLDYISDTDEINTDIRLRLLVGQNSRARLPMNKLLKRELIEASTLHSSEKEKLIAKISTFSNFESNYNTITQSSVFRRDTADLDAIISSKEKKQKIYETISFNIKHLNLDGVKSFLVGELKELKEKGEIRLNTEMRRVLLLYDIVKNKRGNA
ncbi:SIR2 family protein [Paenibacillus daejeonensis]|uniref:SIR2 family protein n=1 Tax=Paenibacillus daejeonensis TaxID=135193 RepID=UPI0012FC97BB|nr:SIR2 family protein [Paenibacillus daejeonensis]